MITDLIIDLVAAAIRQQCSIIETWAPATAWNKAWCEISLRRLHFALEDLGQLP